MHVMLQLRLRELLTAFDMLVLDDNLYPVCFTIKISYFHILERAL